MGCPFSEIWDPRNPVTIFTSFRVLQIVHKGFLGIALGILWGALIYDREIEREREIDNMFTYTFFMPHTYVRVACHLVSGLRCCHVVGCIVSPFGLKDSTGTL